MFYLFSMQIQLSRHSGRRLTRVEIERRREIGPARPRVDKSAPYRIGIFLSRAHARWMCELSSATGYIVASLRGFFNGRS
jgi:hypothetical protein